MGEGFKGVKPLRNDDVLATEGSPRQRGRDAVEYLRDTMEAPPDLQWEPTPQRDRRREPRSA